MIHNDVIAHMSMTKRIKTNETQQFGESQKCTDYYYKQNLNGNGAERKKTIPNISPLLSSQIIEITREATFFLLIAHVLLV